MYQDDRLSCLFYSVTRQVLVSKSSQIRLKGLLINLCLRFAMVNVAILNESKRKEIKISYFMDFGHQHFCLCPTERRSSGCASSGQEGAAGLLEGHGLVDPQEH